MSAQNIISCVLLLSFGLLFGCSETSNQQLPSPPSDDKALAVEVAVAPEESEVDADSVSQRTEPVAKTQPDVASTTLDETGAVVDQSANQTTPTGPPEIGPLMFALDTTASGEPIKPDFIFPAGVSQIHAVFEYQNLRPDIAWTQVWYHDGNEILSTSQPWLDAETGRYDYPIDAGGQPLPIGQWALEFYVEDTLLTAGSFVIEPEAVLSETTEITDTVEILKVYRFAYTKWTGDKHDLYMGDTNGYNEQFLMGRAAGPSWSPDGRYLFFYGEQGVDQQAGASGRVYPYPGVTNGIARLGVNPAPANVAQLQMYQGAGWNDGSARTANVSPDGTMIAYDGDRGGGRRIYFLGTDANQQFRVEIIGEQTDWSPDSQRIVFRSGRFNQTGIWIANRDGSGAYRLTYDGSDSFPTWSPDGQTIAFSRDVGGDIEIYSVNLDGSNLIRLTAIQGHDTLPVYLPNGDLLFRSAREGRWGIWKMKADGSEQAVIVPNATVGPDWTHSRMTVLR